MSNIIESARLTKKDFETDQDVRWCPGCGDYAILATVQRCRERGLDVSHAHVRYMNPFPKNLGDLLKRFDHVLVPELNNGQLVKMIRSQYLVPAESLPKIQGQPFKIAELEDKIRQVLES